MPGIIDVMIIIIQAILFGNTISCCTKKVELEKNYIMIILIFAVNFGLGKLTKELSILNIFLHFISIIMVYYLYKYDKKVRIINYSIFYIFNCTTIIIVINMLRFLITFIDYHGNKDLLTKYLYFIIYMFLSLIYILGIKDICTYCNKKKKGSFIIILSIIMAFIMSIINENALKDDLFSIYISLIISHIFIALVSFYFFILYIKSKNIFKLNKCLELKNIELKDIKDKHSLTIRYLQKMCLLNCEEEVGIILKEIINGNDSIIYKQQIDCEKISNNENSLINIITKNIINEGIQVNLDDKFNTSCVKINEMELYRIVTNIVNNAIRVLKDVKNPTINIRIYKINTQACIEIQNNGPMIEEKNIKNIFERGFTTKENSDSSHGYGLSIVKELIESNHGTIEVTSTKFDTIFKIILPIKSNN